MQKIQNRISLNTIWIAFISLSTSALAGDQVGTVTQIEGTVKIFSHPSKTLTNEAGGPHALFEGEYFQVQDAKIGDSVDKGNIVRTAPGAKARVVYSNGDQINVGPATAYRVTWDKDSNQGRTQVTLAYGKLRGVIEKGGPRSKLQIRTRTAVMGVRGTDFFIAQGGAADESTEVSIIRGEVEVKPKAPEAKPIPVKAGFSAEIPPPPPAPTDRKTASTETKPLVQPQVELRKTTQEEFVGIQKSSTITAPPKETANVNPEVKKSIENLEKKATATVLNDIKTHDQKLYAVLEKQGTQAVSIDQINQASMQVLIKEAPKAPPKRKPFKSEIDNLEDGAYERYFKHIE
jgi:hypothetical protein